MKKQMILILGILFLSTSCIDLDGRMNVVESLEVKAKTGFLKLKKQTTTISPGYYKAELKLKSSKNANIKLSGNGMKPITIALKSDYKLNIPANGRFEIRGSEVGQPINIQGQIQTRVSEYGHASGTESCSYTQRRTQCLPVCQNVVVHGRHGSYTVSQCNNVCSEHIVNIYGYKHVSYHYKQIDRNVSLEFMRENSTYVAATMDGSSSDTNRIVTSESSCR